MESYIIRIYRHENQENITGTVRPIERTEKYAFSNIDELWKILQQPEARLEELGSSSYI